MDYAIRVIATNQIIGVVSISAECQEEALAKVKQRISPKLKQEGYEFQLEFLETLGRGRWSAARTEAEGPKDGNCVGNNWQQSRVWPRKGEENNGVRNEFNHTS